MTTLSLSSSPKSPYLNCQFNALLNSKYHLISTSHKPSRTSKYLFPSIFLRTMCYGCSISLGGKGGGDEGGGGGGGDVGGGVFRIARRD